MKTLISLFFLCFSCTVFAAVESAEQARISAESLRAACYSASDRNAWESQNLSAVSSLIPYVASLDSGDATWAISIYVASLNKGKGTWTEGLDLLKTYDYPLYIMKAATSAEVLEYALSSEQSAAHNASIGAIRLGILQDNFQTFLGKGTMVSRYQALFSRYLLSLTNEQAITVIEAEQKAVLACLPESANRTKWLSELALKLEIYKSHQ